MELTMFRGLPNRRFALQPYAGAPFFYDDLVSARLV